LPPGENEAKVGLDDFLAAGNASEELSNLASPELRPLPTEKEPPAPSTGQRLIEIASKATLFRSEREEAFAYFPVDGHSATWPVRSRAFRRWLSLQFYNDSGKPPNTQALEEALHVLEAKCDFHGEMLPLSLRMAQDGDALWLDLVDEAWKAVRITAQGWNVDGKPPPIFRRYAPAAAQVLPTTSGNLLPLRQFVNVRDENLYRQLVVWLVASFFPRIAHPVLVVYGEQGSAKSTLMRLLAMLVDPSKVPLRAVPRDIGEWIQAADHSWLVTLDNVSNLSGWLSDALCRAVTGEGFSKRQLYSDAEDVIIEFRRVVALTGIEIVPERSDLFDRALLLELKPIVPERRRTEAEVLDEFERVRPEILGGLLDVVAGVLHELPSVKLSYLPRMADFARIGVAVERVLGWPVGTFMAAYGSNIAGQHEEVLSTSILGEQLQMLMKDRAEWAGTATELLNLLNQQAGEAAVRRRDWPKSARAVSGDLRRLSPNLRAVGLEVNSTTPHGKRLITLTRMGAAKTVPTLPSVLSSRPDGTQDGNSGTQSGSDGTQPKWIIQDGNAGNARSSYYSGSSCFGLTDADAPVTEVYEAVTLNEWLDENDFQRGLQSEPLLATENNPSSRNVSPELPSRSPSERRTNAEGQNGQFGQSSERSKGIPDVTDWNIVEREEFVL